MFYFNMIFIYSKLLVVLLPFLLAQNVEGSCYTQDNDFVGNPVRDIKDFHIDEIYSPDDCQSQCEKDCDCQFWVWNGPNSNGNRNTCWLKSNNTESAVRTGKVSGPKCCSDIVCPDNEDEDEEQEEDQCESNTSRADNGYSDAWRGWYDLQGCGKCYDYCRWVGGNGSGGDPNARQIYGNSFWSCRRAGTNEAYSPKGAFDSDTLWVKCTDEGARVPKEKICCVCGTDENQATETPDVTTETPDETTQTPDETTQTPDETTENSGGTDNGHTIDCSSFYMDNTAVGRGRGNGIPSPNGRVNNVESVEDCRAECAKIRDCKFFVWNSPTAIRKPLSCWLKKNDNNQRSSSRERGRISGPVTCDVEEGQNMEGDVESEDGTIE